MNPIRIGVLALQGDFREHREILQKVGADVVEVRKPEHLAGLRGIVLPGGESTAISKLLKTSGLFDALTERLNGSKRDGAPLAVFGTCAGVILSAREVKGAVSDQRSFGILDAVVQRNGIGPQRYSREVALDVAPLDNAVFGVFIRPPVIEEVGPSVEVLATYRDRPVLCAQGRHLFATFHPELTADDRIHRLFLQRLSIGGLQA